MQNQEPPLVLVLGRLLVAHYNYLLSGEYDQVVLIHILILGCHHLNSALQSCTFHLGMSFLAR